MGEIETEERKRTSVRQVDASWTGASLVDYDFLSDYYKLEDDSTYSRDLSLAKSPTRFSREESLRELVPWAPEVAEAGVQLATLLAAQREGSGSVAYLFVGPTGEEGTSTVVQVTSEMLAAAHHSVLLVGTDLQDRSVGQRYGITRLEGLVDVQFGRVSWQEVAHRTPIARLCVMPAGVLRMGESQSEAGLQDLLAMWAAEFEFIIFDLPPVLKSSVIGMLTPFVQRVVLVTRAHATRREVAQKAVATLKDLDARIAAVVLNHRDFPLPGWLYKML